ncbi:hypothetical protein D3C83_237010 [compost metagenome]
MPVVDDCQHLVGGQMLAAGKERIGDFDALVGGIDAVVAQHVAQVVPRVIGGLHTF